MKECNKFIDSLILYYNPPDYNSLADYNSPDLISAEEIGIRKGWKAALEQVLLWGSDDDVLFNKIKDEIYGG